MSDEMKARMEAWLKKDQGRSFMEGFLDAPPNSLRNPITHPNAIDVESWEEKPMLELEPPREASE